MSAAEIHKLAADLSAAGPKMVAPMRKVWDEIGEETAKRWRENAELTSGEVGKHYPKSIDHELKFSTNLSVEIGPNSDKPQGSMGRGFEFAVGRQTTPHLGGLRAMTVMEPLAEVAARSAIDRLIP